jgi:glycosyltransferase involved in cell wall biosynthesis
MTTLGVFFTRGVSLRLWVESGLFDREVLIYHAHLDSEFFSKIYWFTYGDDDESQAKKLYASGRLSRKIEVVGCPRWFRFAGRARSALYSLLLPAIAGNQVSRCDVLKTNQMDGSIPAFICAGIWQRPLYVRTGYTLSRVIEKTSPSNWLRRVVAFVNEYLAFRLASSSSVSSRYDRDYIVQRYGEKVPQPMIVGNYVDTALFSPPTQDEKVNNRILYVGRLSPEKNLDNAIAACATVGLGLDVIGTGTELPHLRKIAVKCGASVRWLGVVPNNQLPELFHGYRYFILPSLWEGLPKALIEAMSAGLICIGNDTTGINEIIEDGVTGYLSPSADAAALAKTLRRALAGDHDHISCAGREFACNEFSLDAIAAKEQAIFTSILATKR